MRIAMIGSRGIPADLPKSAGGERGVEEISVRLVQRGHKVVVYCRRHYNPAPPGTYYKGIELVSLPSVETREFDTLSHSFVSILHIIRHDTADIVHMHGLGNALLVPMLKPFGRRSLVGIDGLDWERPKWGRFARMALKIAAHCAACLADGIYVDNQVAQAYYRDRFARDVPYIPQGTTLLKPGTKKEDILAEWGLESEQYILFVGKLTPDKGVHLLVEAYEGLDTERPLVIVGDSPDYPEYVAHLRSTADPRVQFLGYVYGDGYAQLCSHAYIYVQPSLMEGTSPSLLAAMGAGRCVVVSGIPQLLETISDAGVAFTAGSAVDLRTRLQELLGDPERAHTLGTYAAQRVRALYDWDKVVKQLEVLYTQILHSETRVMTSQTDD